MKTFSQFLSESYDWHPFRQGSYRHKSKLPSGDDVHIAFNHTGDSRDSHELVMQVNGVHGHSLATRPESTPKDRVAIGYHATRAIDSFLSKTPLKKIHFYAHNKHHEKNFEKLASHISKKHEYTHTTSTEVDDDEDHHPITTHILTKKD